MTTLVRIPVVDLHGADVVPLPLGLGTRRLRLLDDLPASLQGSDVERDERVRASAHRDTPVAHRTRRVGLRHCGECLDGLWEEERVQHRQSELELLLGGGRAGDGEMDGAEFLVPAPLLLGFEPTPAEENCRHHEREQACRIHMPPPSDIWDQLGFAISAYLRPRSTLATCARTADPCLPVAAGAPSRS